MKISLVQLGDIGMSEKFDVQQTRPSKIQVEVKDIRQNSLNKNLETGLNFDGEGDSDNSHHYT